MKTRAFGTWKWPVVESPTKVPTNVICSLLSKCKTFLKKKTKTTATNDNQEENPDHTSQAINAGKSVTKYIKFQSEFTQIERFLIDCGKTKTKVIRAVN